MKNFFKVMVVALVFVAIASLKGWEVGEDPSIVIVHKGAAESLTTTTANSNPRDVR